MIVLSIASVLVVGFILWQLWRGSFANYNDVGPNRQRVDHITITEPDDGIRQTATGWTRKRY